MKQTMALVILQDVVNIAFDALARHGMDFLAVRSRFAAALGAAQCAVERNFVASRAFSAGAAPRIVCFALLDGKACKMESDKAFISQHKQFGGRPEATAKPVSDATATR